MNEVIKAMLERRSCRSYEARQVEEDALQQILLAGTYAASGMGRQAAKIVVVQDAETIEQLRRMNAAVMGTPDADPFYGAPTVCIVLADPDVRTWTEDGSLVMGNLMLAASTLGVASCWIHRAREEFDSPEGKALLKKWGIDERYRGIGHCILGYAAAPLAAARARKDDYIVRV
ncbi:MAG: nitroreductase family protein [Oscillospiraceae bacterium]|nr:nitroreductase family protein [Oscillospiraceae bacterium]